MFDVKLHPLTAVLPAEMIPWNETMGEPRNAIHRGGQIISGRPNRMV